jgi:hypothetical protein
LKEAGAYQSVGEETKTGEPSAGKFITWQVVSGGGIDSIKSVDVHKVKGSDAKQKDIWQDVPKKNDSKGLSWIGRLKDDLEVGSWDGYDITVNTTDFGKQTIDPKVPTYPGP